jgi:integrase
MDRNVIEIRNDPAGVKRVRRRTKNRSNRVLPIHTELKAVLSGMKRTADGWVLHGPRGARLKADTVRTCLVRDVIRPLRPRFPSDEGDAGFQAGRLHSFRHYFCSRSANQGIPERVVSNWLGHRDSRMIQRYYHLVNEESQRQMKKLVCILPDAGSVAGAAADAEPGATAATPECA